ncbi:gluconate 5-dehydrogenase [Falsiroseomonas bella]|uniref:Gluconate 5-dehydrogenase n=1 Tax=Falsiroseomonas bella TaxID=2184016 RepID=A0A317FLM7_9PROT|nr:SDR family oxidoreductase [Falsiroseomonas bella]PWS38869.1 gluconate 5-dehydrogenase [Falsiroseomonas bella]
MPSPQHAALFDLTGRVALVTGGSRGLGAAMAVGFARAGAEVILNGRDQAALDRQAEAMRAEGLRVRTAVFDVCDRAAMDAVVPGLGPIDILMHNAGHQHRGPVETLTDEGWYGVLDTHLTALFRLSRLLVPGMKERRRGKILAIGSLASDLGRGTITPYAAAKGGLKMFIRALAVELGPYNVQCNAIGPGWFDTEINKPLLDNPEWLATVKRRCPAGRYAQPEEIAGTAVFLASPASDFVSGQLIFVDGGVTANMM